MIIPPAVVLLFAIHQTMYPPISDDEIAATRKLCEDMPLPSSFTKLQDGNVIKSGLAVFENRYSSDADAAGIEDHFKGVLRDGWDFRRETDGEGVKLIFEKEPFLITLRYYWLELTSRRQYVLTCSCRRD